MFDEDHPTDKLRITPGELIRLLTGPVAMGCYLFDRRLKGQEQ
jgi:hypothetical protein